MTVPSISIGIEIVQVYCRDKESTPRAPRSTPFLKEVDDLDMPDFVRECYASSSIADIIDELTSGALPDPLHQILIACGERAMA